MVESSVFVHKNIYGIPVQSFLSAILHSDICENKSDSDDVNNINDIIFSGENGEISRIIDYIVLLADIHDQTPITKFNTIELFLRLIKMPHITKINEIQILACLQLCSKFFEENYMLDSNILQQSHGKMDGKLRFSVKDMCIAEMTTFKDLDWKIDPNSSFFVYVEIFILSMDWDRIDVSELYDVCDTLTTLLYIKYDIFCTKWSRKDILAASIILSAFVLSSTGNFDDVIIIQLTEVLSRICKCTIILITSLAKYIVSVTVGEYLTSLHTFN